MFLIYKTTNATCLFGGTIATNHGHCSIHTMRIFFHAFLKTKKNGIYDPERESTPEDVAISTSVSRTPHDLEINLGEEMSTEEPWDTARRHFDSKEHFRNLKTIQTRLEVAESQGFCYDEFVVFF